MKKIIMLILLAIVSMFFFAYMNTRYSNNADNNKKSNTIVNDKIKLNEKLIEDVKTKIGDTVPDAMIPFITPFDTIKIEDINPNHIIVISDSTFPEPDLYNLWVIDDIKIEHDWLKTKIIMFGIDTVITKKCCHRVNKEFIPKFVVECRGSTYDVKLNKRK